MTQANIAAREFATTVIARTKELSSKSPLRRCIHKHAKAMISLIDAEARSAALGRRSETITIGDVTARITDACENAATWSLNEEGRAQLAAVLRTEDPSRAKTSNARARAQRLMR